MTTWSVLVPQKALERAKGRLELTGPERRLVAVAMLTDTLETLRACASVAEVLVLWDDPADAGLVPQVPGLATTEQPLNEALAHGAAHLRDRGSGAIAVVPGDLPALTPAVLTLCLTRAAGAQRAFLPDAENTGTTVLTALTGHPLSPRYGTGSALEHAASGARQLALAGLDPARSDVDDVESLRRALEIGCGRHTLAACTSSGLVLEPVR